MAPQVPGAVIQRWGDYDAAEDGVQEALLAPSVHWPEEGLPDNPAGRLIQTATRSMTDQFRGDAARRRKEDLVARQEPTAPQVDDKDDTLKLLFMCCHPALTPPSAIALTSRAVGGLTTAEIAGAYLMPEATMAQRISRAKQRIKASGLPFEIPSGEDHPQRLRAVVHVLYLILNEGYTTTEGTQLALPDLTTEAIRLARSLHTLPPALARRRTPLARRPYLAALVRRPPEHHGFSVPAMSRDELRQRYLEINGDHPMSEADDAYVTRQFRVLDELCAEQGRDVEAVRRLMLGGELPMPGYLRSDGAEMIPADLFGLADKHGDGLREWFIAQWSDVATGNEEGDAYLSGRYVCLHSVTPSTIQREDELMRAIDSTTNPAELKPLVDGLDELEPEFTAYDRRLRFDGPVSRDTHITAVRTDGEVSGLLALMLLIDARCPARAPDGRIAHPAGPTGPSPLGRDAHHRRSALVADAMSHGSISEYQMHAAIAQFTITPHTRRTPTGADRPAVRPARAHDGQSRAGGARPPVQRPQPRRLALPACPRSNT
ncbi:DUF6058 family natural product biosynthesis protein [Kribbella qitaiheensis]|uniref:DUF6058 family natural product biosynthesis protein n=1 Tax=Kribbella qitaiheensis TaxID=1544730 RepID=UPI00360E9949